MARGGSGAQAAHAQDLTKWFDTNYHYLVPELVPRQTFRLASNKPFAELAEARAAGVPAKPVLLGPDQLPPAGKSGGEDEVEPLSLLDALLPVYAEVIQKLAAGWSGVDPDRRTGPGPRSHPGGAGRRHACLRGPGQSEGHGQAAGADRTSATSARPIPTLASLPVDGIGLDFVRGRENLDLMAQHGFPADKWLAAGVVDGRNVWTN